MIIRTPVIDEIVRLGPRIWAKGNCKIWDFYESMVRNTLSVMRWWMMWTRRRWRINFAAVPHENVSAWVPSGAERRHEKMPTVVNDENPSGEINFARRTRCCLLYRWKSGRYHEVHYEGVIARAFASCVVIGEGFCYSIHEKCSCLFVWFSPIPRFTLKSNCVSTVKHYIKTWAIIREIQFQLCQFEDASKLVSATRFRAFGWHFCLFCGFITWMWMLKEHSSFAIKVTGRANL